MKTTAPQIDPEFQALVGPLTPDERRELENNLLRDGGCLDPLVTRRGRLLDGYHRYEICKRVGIPFEVVAIDLDDRDAAKAWIIHNQLGRRNLNPFSKIELALKLEPIIAAQARKNIRTATGGRKRLTLPKSGMSKPVNTEQELAQVAGVGHTRFFEGRVLVERAAEDVKEALRNGLTTIHSAYLLLTKKPAESAERIESAEQILGPELHRSLKEEPNDRVIRASVVVRRVSPPGEIKVIVNRRKTAADDGEPDPITKATSEVQGLALGFCQDANNLVTNFVAAVNELDIDVAVRGFVQLAAKDPARVARFLEEMREAGATFGKNEASFWLANFVKRIEQEIESSKDFPE